MSDYPKWRTLLHELWGWCKEQPGYEPNRSMIKGKFSTMESEIFKSLKRERKTQRRKGERRRT